MSIKEFFNLYGENKFREIEHNVITEVFKNKVKDYVSDIEVEE